MFLRQQQISLTLSLLIISGMVCASSSLKAPSDEVAVAQRSQIDMNCFSGLSSLHKATYFGHTSLMQELLQHFLTTKQFDKINAQDELGWTVVHHAVASKDARVVQTLRNNLSSAQYLSLLAIKTKQGYSAIHLAIDYDSRPMIKALLRDVSATETIRLLTQDINNDGLSPQKFTEALANEGEIAHDVVATIKIELNFAQNKEIACKELSALQRLAWIKDFSPDLMQRILEDNPKAIYEQNHFGLNALHCAIAAENVRMVQEICSVVPPVQFFNLAGMARDRLGSTAFSCAEEKDNQEIIALIKAKLHEFFDPIMTSSPSKGKYHSI